jgi:membrane protease YdiL (CAAX protease family)
MPRLRRATGSWVLAVALSTVPFAMLHLLDQQAIAIGPIAILSIVFSVVTIMRRSIVPAIIGHTLFNLSQFLALVYQAGNTWN